MGVGDEDVVETESMPSLSELIAHWETRHTDSQLAHGWGERQEACVSPREHLAQSAPHSGPLCPLPFPDLLPSLRSPLHPWARQPPECGALGRPLLGTVHRN